MGRRCRRTLTSKLSILDIRLKILDTQRVTSEERTTWTGLLSLVAVPAVYLVWSLSRGGIPGVGWERPLVTSFVALVVVGVLASVLGTVIAAARARTDEEPDAIAGFDERDARVRDRGARLSGLTLGLWVVALFVLAVSHVPQVWIAHAAFAAVVVAGSVDAVARIATYRRGG